MINPLNFIKRLPANYLGSFVAVASLMPFFYVSLSLFWNIFSFTDLSFSLILSYCFAALYYVLWLVAVSFTEILVLYKSKNTKDVKESKTQKKEINDKVITANILSILALSVSIGLSYLVCSKLWFFGTVLIVVWLGRIISDFVDFGRKGKTTNDSDTSN